MTSEHSELKVRIELLYHAEFEGIHSPAFAREESWGHELQTVYVEGTNERFRMTMLELEIRTLDRVSHPPFETDHSETHRTTTLPAVVDMKCEPYPR